MKFRGALRFVIPLFLVAVALAVRVMGHTIFGLGIYLLLYPTVYAGALIGGFWAGALATTVATLGTWYFVVPGLGAWRFSDRRELIGAAFFWLSGIVFSIYAEKYRSALDRERSARTEAEVAGEQLRAARERFEAVLDRTLGSPRDLRDVLQEIIETAIEITDADFGDIQLVDSATQELKIVTQSNLPQFWLDYWNGFPMGHGACSAALAAGHRVIVDDVAHSSVFSDEEGREIHLRAGVRTIQCTPLYGRSAKVIGIFSTHYRNPGRPADQDLRLLDLLSRLAAEAVEQRHLKDQLGESEEKYSILFRSSPFAAALIRIPEEIAVDVNAEFLKLFEVAHDEVVGKPCMDLQVLDPQSRDRIRKGLEARESIHDFEYTRASRFGTQRLLSLNLNYVQISGKEHVLTTVRDVTERRDKEIAEETNRVKEQFLATLSHELRTPLAAILSWAQLLKKGDRNEAMVSKGLNIIEQCAEAQGQLINDLLDLSRIDAGKLVLDLQVVNSVYAITTAVDTVRREVERKKQTLEVVMPSKGGSIRCDPTRMQQILWNLLSNAIKFTRESGKIRVELKEKDGMATINVSDNGRGISPGVVKKIFERFAQGDSSTTREFGGLGLGLSLVKSLTEMQGGSVRADSPGVGLGATFSVEFPIASEPSHQSYKSEIPTDVPSLAGIRILLVDDEGPTGEGVAGLLASLGAQVQLKGSAKEAFESLINHPPDVVVSDIAMPIEDGYSLVRKIRTSEIPEIRSVPTIAMTAFTGSESRDKAVQAGFSGYVMKPIHIAVLAEKIQGICRSRLEEGETFQNI